MRVIRRISAVLIGFVFFLSGILKLMDPVGTRLIVEEYLRFLHLGFLMGVSGGIGSALSLLETWIGAALITGVWRKVAAVVTGVMLGGFTLLTLLLYIKNPSMDCGCFGEAIHLTHAQSLLKNVILLALWAIACLPLRKQEQTRIIKFVSFPLAAVSVLLFMLFFLMNNPLVDFTPFSPGSELMLAEDIEDPGDITTPTLPISDAQGQYVDRLLLEGRELVVSVYEPEQLSPRRWEKLAELIDDAASLGYRPMLLTAATPEQIGQFVTAPEVLGITYFADRKNLLTLNRSNGGATVLQDGLIVAKWHHRHLPGHDKLAELSATDVTESLLSENNGDRLKFQAFLLYVFAVMLLF